MKQHLHSPLVHGVIALVGVFVFLFLLVGEWDIGDAQTDPAPRIMSPRIEDIASTTAVITWRTDKPADALINYGLDSFYGIARNPDFEATEHRITLENLRPSTQYFFRIVSSDAQANQGIREGFRFTTQASIELEEVSRIADLEQRSLTEQVLELLDQIDDLEALQLIMEKLQEKAEDIFDPVLIIGTPRVEAGEEEVLVTWFTDRESSSVVELAPENEFNPDNPNYTIVQGDPNALATSHSVRVVGLRPATTYHFRVISRPLIGPEGVSRDHTFTTRAITPAISAISLDKVEEESATVSWRTTIPSRGQVIYTNLQTGEVRTAGDPTFLTSHSVHLQNLEFATPYRAIIEVENELGDKVQSAPIDFTTVKDEFPPVISRVTNESTLFPGDEVRIQTIIGWETDEPAICQLFFHQGLVAAADEVTSLLPGENFVTRHVEVITRFAPATVYKFWMTCADRAGNESRSEDFVLFTPEKEKSIIDIILENFEGSFGWIKNITG